MPVVTWNVPQIPDRQKAFAGTGESPLPAMLKGIAALNAAGAQRIVIPCNTAHYWFDALQAASAAPIIHIADATVALLQGAGQDVRMAGLLATRVTLDAGLYQQRLALHGIACIENTAGEMDALFTPGCYAVKRGEFAAGGALLEQAAQCLMARGAQRLILACTEVPLAFERIGSALLPAGVDSNRALALACVRYWEQARGDG